MGNRLSLKKHNQIEPIKVENVHIPLKTVIIDSNSESDDSSTQHCTSNSESKFFNKHRVNLYSDETITPESSYDDGIKLPSIVKDIYNDLSIIVLITNIKFDIKYVNGYITNCIETKCDDLLNTNLFGLINSDFHEVIHNYYRNTNKTNLKLRLTIKNSKNKDYWVDVKFIKSERNGNSLITIFMKPIHIEIRLSNLLDNIQKDYDYLRNNVLANIFPSYILPYVLSGDRDFILEHDNIIVGAFDIVNFSEECAINKTSFKILKPLYYEAQKLCELHNLYCVEIIGDAMIIAGNCSNTRKNNVDDMINFMLDFIKFCTKRTDLDIRCGIAVGRAISGMIGYNQFRYHIFGNAVNIAARMESLSEHNKVRITSNVYDQISPSQYSKYNITTNEAVPVKGLGMMNTYTVNGYNSCDSLTVRSASVRRSMSERGSQTLTYANTDKPDLFAITNQELYNARRNTQSRIHSRVLSQCM